jgi:hypothetical protein
MHVAPERQAIEGGQVAAATTHAADRLGGIGPDLLGRSIRLRRQVRWIHRSGFEFPGEAQQQLSGIGVMLERVGPRTVVPLLQPQQFQLQTQLLDLQFLAFFLKLPGLLLQCDHPPLLGSELCNFRVALLRRFIALTGQIGNDRLEGGGVVGEVD